MKKKWMIFRSETHSHYYLYNGRGVVDFTPGEKITWDDYRGQVITKLDKALNSRTRLMVVNNTRYLIVTRGEFLEE